MGKANVTETEDEDDAAGGGGSEPRKKKGIVLDTLADIKSYFYMSKDEAPK